MEFKDEIIEIGDIVYAPGRGRVGGIFPPQFEIKPPLLEFLRFNLSPN